MSGRAVHALRAAAWMTIAQVLFATMAVGARLVGRDVPWQEVCGSRMAVALVVAWVVAKARRQSLAISDQKHAWLRSSFGTLSAAGTFWIYAQPRLALGDAVTIFSTSPIFVALLSWPLLGERVRGAVVAAIACAFVGILFVAQPSFGSAKVLVLVGVLTAIGSAIAQMYVRKMGAGETSEAIVFHFMCVGTVALALASVPVWKTPDLRDALYMLVTGLAGGLAQITMTRAYALDTAARVSTIGYSGIVFVRVFAIPIFGEVPTIVQVAGSLLVIASGVGLALRREKKHRE